MRTFKPLAGLLFLCLPLVAQTSTYPGTLDTDQTLAVAVNNFSAKLASAINSTDTAWALTGSTATPLVNMLLTVDSEVVQVQSVVGNLVTVVRAKDGTSAASHKQNSVVQGLNTAWHHNVLRDGLKKTENALGPNLSHVQELIDAAISAVEQPTLPFRSATDYNFTAQTPGGSLIAGNNTVTLTPVPKGVNGTDANHYVSIANGVGSTESCLINGGSAVGGASTGTVIINCSATHSGSWTIQSATAGIQEAACSFGSIGGEVDLTPGTYTLRAGVGTCGTTSVSVRKGPGAVIAGGYPVLGSFTAGTGAPELFQPRVVSGKQNTILDPGPLTGNAGTPYHGFRVNVGGFPDSLDYDGVFGTAGSLQGIVGAVDTYSNTYNTTFSGVSGYARGNAQTSNNAVGLLGLSVASDVANGGGGVWGANASAVARGKNAPLWGAEFDAVALVPGTPPTQIFGVQAIANKIHRASGSEAAFAASSIGTSPWLIAFACGYGGAEYCLISYPKDLTANNSDSQVNTYIARDSGGTLLEADEQLKATGLLQKTIPAGGAWKVTNGTTDYIATGIGSGFTFVKNGSTLTELTPLTQAALAAISPPAGSVAYCSDCAPASTPCAGSGSGALAFRNGTQWVCR